jgi:small subunit ribosomal protein S3
LGRKVHPYGFRLGIIKEHKARWYAEGETYVDLLEEDLAVRDLVSRENDRASVSSVEIERLPAAKQLTVRIWTAKPGIVIGRKGANVNSLRRKLEELTSKKVHVDVQEIENPDIDAYLVAESIAQQLERRISHKRAMNDVFRTGGR